MERFEDSYFSRPRAAWGEGPWQDEPDRRVWVDEASGFACLAVRNPMGAWNGYVGLPSGHRAWGRDFRQLGVLVPHVELTFAAPEFEWRESIVGAKTCPEPSDINRWWVGFHCSTAWEYNPAHRFRVPGMRYRPLVWVEWTVTRLARALGGGGETELAEPECLTLDDVGCRHCGSTGLAPYCNPLTGQQYPCSFCQRAPELLS